MHQIYFILEWHSTCFGRSFRPSSGVQDCTYSNRHLSNRYCCLVASKQTAVSTPTRQYCSARRYVGLSGRVVVLVNPTCSGTCAGIRVPSRHGEILLLLFQWEFAEYIHRKINEHRISETFIMDTAHRLGFSQNNVPYLFLPLGIH